MNPYYVSEDFFPAAFVFTLVGILLVSAYIYFIPPDAVCMEFGRARFEKRERCVVWTDGEKHWSHYER